MRISSLRNRIQLFPKIDINHSNFRSYSNAAISTTKHDPALCTKAPVVGFSLPRTESVTARKLMHMESVMLSLMVLIVALFFQRGSSIRCHGNAMIQQILFILP